MKIADLGLPSVFYHGTSFEALPNILKHGLDPDSTRWKRSQHVVFLTDEPHVAENYVHGFHTKGVVLAVDTRGLNQKLLRPDDYELPEFMDEPWDEVGEDLAPYRNYYDVPWQLSLKYVQQVGYAGKIAPKWISIFRQIGTP